MKLVKISINNDYIGILSGRKNKVGYYDCFSLSIPLELFDEDTYNISTKKQKRKIRYMRAYLNKYPEILL